MRNQHNNEVKKHIKFDELNRCLYIQIKHERDREWVDFSVEQARIEKEKLNAKNHGSLIYSGPLNLRARTQGKL